MGDDAIPHGSYTLWGTPHSLYTGKIRSYLIKKGLPFRERMPSDARYLETVLPAIRQKVVPVVQTPDGRFLQDTTSMIDDIEAHAPGPAMIPESLILRFVAEVLDAYGAEFLLPTAMHYRWSYRREQESFLEAEFGRSSYQGPDRTEQRNAGKRAMAYFSGFLPRLGVSSASIPAIETSYLELLEVLDRHLQAYPYLLGGRPSIADFGFMAPLYAHLGRDPYPANLMKLRAPNVFRWTERMNTPGIYDAEFTGPSGFFPVDAIPKTLEELLRLVFADVAPELGAQVTAFNAWVDGLGADRRGRIASLDGQRRVHPNLGSIRFTWRGCEIEKGCAPQTLWHFDRAAAWARAARGTEQVRLSGLIEQLGGHSVGDLQLATPLRREDYVLVLG